MKPTIKDVAKAAGVSPSTVSRALHGSTRISADVRARIQSLAAEMRFVPNQLARSLVNRESRIVGVEFPLDAGASLSHPFFPAVLQGLGGVAGKRGYHLLLGTGGEAVSRLAQSGYVSGIVALSGGDRDAGAGVPVVVVGRPADPTCCDSVDTDNVRAGYEATLHLIQRGHERVALLGFSEEYPVTVDRREGWERALCEHGLAPRAEWVVASRFIENRTDGARLREIFGAESRPTAVVSMDDALSIGLAGVLRDMGLSVPQDVSVVSFNNTEAARCFAPPLTSMDIGARTLGERAMSLMLDRLENKLGEPVHERAPFELIERGSVRALIG